MFQFAVFHWVGLEFVCMYVGDHKIVAYYFISISGDLFHFCWTLSLHQRFVCLILSFWMLLLLSVLFRILNTYQNQSKTAYLCPIVNCRVELFCWGFCFCSLNLQYSALSRYFALYVEVKLCIKLCSVRLFNAVPCCFCCGAFMFSLMTRDVSVTISVIFVQAPKQCGRGLSKWLCGLENKKKHIWETACHVNDGGKGLL